MSAAGADNDQCNDPDNDQSEKVIMKRKRMERQNAGFDRIRTMNYGTPVTEPVPVSVASAVDQKDR